MPHRDPVARRAYERERHRKRTAERRAQNLCTKCGRDRPAPGRSLCESCLERGRAAEQARYARAKSEGARYGGRDPRAAAEWRGRGTGSECANTPKPGCARPAANESPWRAAPSAIRAGKRGERKSESSTPDGEPPGFAADAGRKSSATLRRAPRAPKGMQNAVRARTPRAGRDITAGEPSRFASIAAPMRTRERDAQTARAARITPRASTRGCPSIRPATRWLNSLLAPSTAPSTPGKRSPCASPSRNSPAMKWRSWKIFP